MRAVHSRAEPRWRDAGRRAVGLLAGVVVFPAAVLSAGTLLPALPYLGTVASQIVPAWAGEFFLLGLAGTALGGATLWLGGRPAGIATAALGLFTAITAGAVIGSHARVASRNGAAVDLLATILPGRALPSAAPDLTVTYTRSDRQPLEMDIYRTSRQPRGGAPVVMYVHGGGWIRGDRKGQADVLRWFADRGFVAFSPGYVLATAGAPTWNTASAQIACAMAWIAKHAQDYGGDARRLAVFGESAGGALALTTAYAAAAGVARASCGSAVPAPRAVAAQYPAVDPVALYDNSNPLRRDAAREMVATYLGGSPREYPERAGAVASETYITPKAPPTLIFLPENDHLVPIAGTLRFIDQAERAGVAVRTVRFPWADHSIQARPGSVAGQSMRQIMLQHFCRQFGDCPD